MLYIGSQPTPKRTASGKYRAVLSYKCIMNEFYAKTLGLFLIMNVIGNVPCFMAVLQNYDAPSQKRILLREMSIALGILLAFAFFGETILKLIGISQEVIGISGGLLLLLVSLTMIFPKPQEELVGLPHHEPLIIPIAIPIIAGPGSIATVMLFANQFPHWWEIGFSILIAWVPSLIIVLFSSYLRFLLGEKGLLAIQKLGGLLVSLISVQMIADGIISLVKINFP